MNRHFYNGSKIEIGKDYIKIKERNIRLNYQEIKSISIKNTRIHRAWLIYVIAGIVACCIILSLFCLLIHGLISNAAALRNSGLFYRKHVVVLLVFFFTGGPFFIVWKVKKYFKKYLMLIIKWDHDDFRIKISDLRINKNDLKKFFADKEKSFECDF